MSSSQVLLTALPRSVDPAAEVHVRAFVTHKLVPDPRPPEDRRKPTLEDFPEIANWPATLVRCRFELLVSHIATPLQLTVASPPLNAADWAVVFPPHLPVMGFPKPALAAAEWRSYPAHRLSDTAVDLHLAMVAASPTARPGVSGHPVAEALLDPLMGDQRQRVAEVEQRKRNRAARLLRCRSAEAEATLRPGRGVQRDDEPDPSKGEPPKREPRGGDDGPRIPHIMAAADEPDDETCDPGPSAVEVLLDRHGTDAATTARLDALVRESTPPPDPARRLLADAHATRGFYQRPEEQTDAHSEHPDPAADPPRPQNREHDVHSRAAWCGSTPALLGPLGLVIDLRLSAADAAALAGATWIAVRLVPPEGSALTVLPPPRTSVVVGATGIVALSSEKWVAGAVPLGEPEYVVLDLDPDASGLKIEQHVRSLPRALVTEVNGDPATSAPGTLRSTGFAVARSDRVPATRERLGRAEGVETAPAGPNGTGQEVGYDDLVRGVRLEVWDDVTKVWHSLHERRVTVERIGKGAASVLEDVPDVGFLQLSGLNRGAGESGPYHLHEVMAGWDGWSLSAPRPGRIVVPRNAAPPAAPDDNSSGAAHLKQLYTVRPGDTLSGIAHDFYGDRELYRLLARVNHLKKSDLLRVGQVLTIPSPRASGGRQEYKVRPGDTLSGIAQHFYGDHEFYRLLARVNHLKNPDLIRVGQRLTIPEAATIRPVAPAPPGGGVMTGAPSAPTGLRASIGQDRRVRLDWDHAPGLTWEVHELLVNPTNTLKATVSTPSSIRGPLKGGDYQYGVIAVNSYGKSPMSGTLKIYVNPSGGGHTLPGPEKERGPNTRDGETVVRAEHLKTGDGLVVTARVAPGSLPMLRHGRSYSFRLLGVDLAGDSLPRSTGIVAFTAETREKLLTAVQQHLDRMHAVYDQRDGRGLLESLRPRLVAALPADPPATAAAGAPPWWRATGDAPPVGAQPTHPQVSLPEDASTGDPAVDAAVEALLAEHGAEAAGADGGVSASGPAGDAAVVPDAASRASRVLVEAPGTLRRRPIADVDLETFAGLCGIADPLLRQVGTGTEASAPPPIIATTPRPFLRWDPVPPPALVPRHALTTGEQLSRLVVRSGIAASPTQPLSDSQRHLLPPKGTQADAEAAGKFDFAIGSADPARQRRAYAWALRERGTLLDRRLPSPDAPGEWIDQPGVELLSRPSANPEQEVDLETIEDQRGTPLGEGQYVVHTGDNIVVPYLPDPYAAGISMLFYDAGAPHLLPNRRPLQGLVVPFEGSWPLPRSLRLVLTGPDPDLPGRLSARVDGNVVRVHLPAGEQVRVALSSSLRADELDCFGLWRSHRASRLAGGGPQGASTPEAAAATVLRRAAVAGWTWWLTPSTDMRLVHAVPVPARAPTLRALTIASRPASRALVQLAGLVDVHGSSTDRLLLRARWVEPTDDPAADAPTTLTREDVVVDSPVGEREHWAVLGRIDLQPHGAAANDILAVAGGRVALHRTVQNFPDTRRRIVTYTPAGATRYREFFSADELAAANGGVASGVSVTLDIPSSARPAAPDVVDTVPLLRWEEETEPAQPYALRRTRRSGVRVWLRRPWYSSGDGELVGVILSAGGDEPFSMISVWGRDPILLGGHTASATELPLVEPRQLLIEMPSGAVVEQPARPVLPEAREPLVDLTDRPVRVLAYRPEYDPSTRRWFVDIALDDGPALWPFIRLALVRYQPHALDKCRLSPVALTSWVQPLPGRTTSVSRPEAHRVRVTVTGTVALLRRADPADLKQTTPDSTGEFGPDTPIGTFRTADHTLRHSRDVHASIQVLPDGASDLEWRSVARRRLPLVGATPQWAATWSAELTVPAVDHTLPPLGLRTPGRQSRWRVLVEEREFLDATADPGAPATAPRTPRTVYLDTITL